MIRILVVDDEPGIRETLPRILQVHGFETASAGTVAEALAAITSEQFDVLISDLNIGEPGDGFTVVSAMRRVQPKCRTLILTGYPAFDTALRAIRTQVDDYIVKPANIPSLIATIESKLEGPSTHLTPAGKRLSALLREQTPEIVRKTLALLLADVEFSSLSINDEQRVDQIPRLLAELAEMLESRTPEKTPTYAMQDAARHGVERQKHGYTASMLVSESRLLLRAIYDTVQDNLLSIDLSYLVVDLKWLDESLFLQLQEMVRAFAAAERDKLAA